MATLALCLLLSLWIIHSFTHPSLPLFIFPRKNKLVWQVPGPIGVGTNHSSRTKNFLFTLCVHRTITLQILVVWTSNPLVVRKSECNSLQSCIIIRLHNRKGWQFCLHLLIISFLGKAWVCWSCRWGDEVFLLKITPFFTHYQNNSTSSPLLLG